MMTMSRFVLWMKVRSCGEQLLCTGFWGARDGGMERWESGDAFKAWEKLDIVEDLLGTR